MKLVTEYLEQVVYFEGMAEQEADKELKAKLAGAAMAWSLSAVDVGPVIRTAAQNGGDIVKAAATHNILLYNPSTPGGAGVREGWSPQEGDARSCYAGATKHQLCIGLAAQASYTPCGSA